MLCSAEDYCQVVVDYAATSRAHGAVYLEMIVDPVAGDRVAVQDVISGCCEGARRALDVHGLPIGVIVCVSRGVPTEVACDVALAAAGYAERGVVGFDLAGGEREAPPEQFVPAFELARDAGLAAVPHAGFELGPDSVRAAMDVLGAVRVGHGTSAASDPVLLAEIAERGVVLDVSLTSEVAIGAAPDLARHPLPAMLEAGVLCSVSTDDPSLFGTDLSREYELLRRVGGSARQAYFAGVEGALCDSATRGRLRALGEAASWQ